MPAPLTEVVKVRVDDETRQAITERDAEAGPESSESSIVRRALRFALANWPALERWERSA